MNKDKQFELCVAEIVYSTVRFLRECYERSDIQQDTIHCPICGYKNRVVLKVQEEPSFLFEDSEALDMELGAQVSTKPCYRCSNPINYFERC